jgi:CHASE2 domain-containing sensor protein
VNAVRWRPRDAEAYTPSELAKAVNKEAKQEQAARRRLIYLLIYLRGAAFWIRALVVLAIVLGINLVIEFGVLTRVSPLLHDLQLGSHRILCWMIPRPASPKWTRMVVIDDELHQKLKEPTDRKYLATLVRNAAQGDAAVIVLDFELTVPKGHMEGDDGAERKDMNDELRNAIFDAAKLGVPVIVPCWLDIGAHKTTLVPSIYPDWALPLAVERNGRSECEYLACARRGNVNPADDERMIPLKHELQGNSQCQDSLALAAASAYEDATDRQPLTREKKSIANEIKSYRYVFGSFVPEERFQTIPIRDLAVGERKAMRACRTRVVVIGGKWGEALGQGRASDVHKTSVGPLTGLYLHANYIETLLDDRYMKEVPPLWALFIDLIVGALLYVSYHKAKTTSGRYFILSVFLLPLMAGYIVFVNLGYYLDFVLPLAGCFVHLGVELVREDLKMRRKPQCEQMVTAQG